MDIKEALENVKILKSILIVKAHHNREKKQKRNR